MRLSFLLLLQGAASRWPLSRVESGAKPPGGIARAAIPPGPPLGFHAVGKAAAFGAALVAEDSFEFPLTRKESSAKSPHGFFGRFRCSRWGLRGRYLAFPSGEGGFGRSPKTDEVSPSSRHPPPFGHSGPNPTNIRKAPKKLVFCRFFARKSLTIPASTCMMEHDFRLLLEVDSFAE